MSVRKLLCPPFETGGLAEFSVDGRRIFAVMSNRVIVWDASTGQPLTPPLGNGQDVLAAVLGPDGRSLVTIGADQQVLWDITPVRPELMPLSRDAPVDDAAFSPDSRCIRHGPRQQQDARSRTRRRKRPSRRNSNTLSQLTVLSFLPTGTACSR